MLLKVHKKNIWPTGSISRQIKYYCTTFTWGSRITSPASLPAVWYHPLGIRSAVANVGPVFTLSITAMGIVTFWKRRVNFSFVIDAKYCNQHSSAGRSSETWVQIWRCAIGNCSLEVRYGVHWNMAARWSDIELQRFLGANVGENANFWPNL